MISAISDLPEDLPYSAPDSDDRLSFLVISAASPGSDDIQDNGATAETSSQPHGKTLRLQLSEGKKGQLEYLQKALPLSMTFIRAQLESGSSICICCDSGKDASVGIALAALQLFFDDDGVHADSPEAQASLSMFISLRRLMEVSLLTLCLQNVPPKSSPSICASNG